MQGLRLPRKTSVAGRTTGADSRIMTSRPELKHLTGLRGLLACWVVAYHYAFVSGSFFELGWFVSKGYLAVDGFLVLSGFVLARSYADLSLTPVGYARYLIRRAGRLFPLHLSVLLVIVVLGLAPATMGALPEAVLMNRWELWPSLETAPINPPDWSLSAEWAMSLALPAFVLVCLRSCLTVRMATGACAVLVLLVILRLHGPQIAVGGSAWPIARCACDFALGVLLVKWRSLGMLATVCAFLALRPFVWLGEISYAVYLVHMHILQALGPSILAVAIVFPIAALCHLAIERPARRLSRQASNSIGRVDSRLTPASIRSSAKSPG
jgi:peptidoglycan/LPS O-acetylase OafA/YrhL